MMHSCCWLQLTSCLLHLQPHSYLCCYCSWACTFSSFGCSLSRYSLSAWSLAKDCYYSTPTTEKTAFAGSLASVWCFPLFLCADSCSLFTDYGHGWVVIPLGRPNSNGKVTEINLPLSVDPPPSEWAYDGLCDLLLTFILLGPSCLQHFLWSLLFPSALLIACPIQHWCLRHC